MNFRFFIFAMLLMSATLLNAQDFLDGAYAFSHSKDAHFTLKTVDKVVVPLVPSIFDMAATEDFLNSIRNEIRGQRTKVGIVAMRVDPRTKAAQMLEEFLKHFDIPIVAYVRNTQNYVNVAAAGATIFDPPRAKHRRDVEQWATITQWLDN